MSKNLILNTITPPESFVNSPLTPPPTDTKVAPRVAHIIDHIRVRQTSCEPIKPWIVFSLPVSDYQQLLYLLRADPSLWGFFQDKVRFDYSSRSCRFVLRMPTTIHEFFRTSVVLNIQGQLQQIAAGTGTAAKFAKAVTYQGSPRLHFPADEIKDVQEGEKGGSDTAEARDQTSTKYNSHEPDAIFRPQGAQWPTVVIEVSFSQKQKDLKDLAEDYILGSDGNVLVVIGLDIEYRRSKRATLSVWRPRYEKDSDGHHVLVSVQTIFEQEFRDALGNPTKELSPGLELQLKDFATEALVQNPETMTQNISIPASVLYDYVVRAEAESEDCKHKRGKMVQLKPGTRKRRRRRTPPEEISSEDEQSFLEDEERAAKKNTIVDSDYAGSSTEPR